MPGAVQQRLRVVPSDQIARRAHCGDAPHAPRRAGSLSGRAREQLRREVSRADTPERVAARVDCGILRELRRRTG
jgi:hypothetical protein